MDRRIFIGGAAAMAAAGGAFVYSRQGDNGRLDLIRVNAQEAAEIDTSGIVDIALGSEDAPVTMVEYASFTCPHCASFHKDVFGDLKADYIDTGKVRFIYREVFFDRYGLWAAMVARCGGQDKYFGISDILYEEQREWLNAESPKDIADNLRTIGKRAGIPDAELEACLSDADQAQAMVARYQLQSEEDGITSTPSFIIDGDKYNNMSYDDLRAVLDEKLGA